MTIFGWDASHYDGTLTRDILGQARSEGVAFFTHKVGEGTNYDDPGDATALASARDAGIEFIGGYFIPRSGSSVSSQVDYLIRLADRDEPWWRSFPGWFWQVDLERWPYDSVPASVGISFANEVRRRTGRWTVLYASHGQYANELGSWNGPLWNAHYTSRAVGGLSAMYPGDNWRPTSGGFVGGWAAYSGREPTILQYTSSATIAGLTTCDANAFRGTVADLRALIKGVNVDELTRLAANGDKWGWDLVTGAQPAKFLGSDGLEHSTDNALHIKLDRIAGDAKTAATRPLGTVVLSAEDRAAIVADLVAALGPLVVQIANAVNDETATRLTNPT